MTKKDLLVVKVGTTVLAQGDKRLRQASFITIAQDIRKLQKRGYGIILVSSSAITAGAIEDGIDRRTISNTVEEQRLAARGWDIVVQRWKKAFGKKRISSALITKHDLETKNTRQKLLGVIDCSLKHGDIFLVNENDCLSDDEIKFGDNDILSATLAVTCREYGDYTSVRLILLTSVPGLNKVANDDNTLIKTVTDIQEVKQYGGDSTNHHSKGGMKSKIMAAEIAVRAGVPAYISAGRSLNPVSSAIAGKTGTYFTASE